MEKNNQNLPRRYNSMFEDRKGALDDPADFILIVVMVIGAYLLMNLLVTESVHGVQKSSAQALQASNNMANEIAAVQERMEKETLFSETLPFSSRSFTGGKIVSLYESLNAYRFKTTGRVAEARQSQLQKMYHSSGDQALDLQNCLYLAEMDLSYLPSPLPLTDMRQKFCSAAGLAYRKYQESSSKRTINKVVIHYTAGGNVDGAVQTWVANQDSPGKASAHYIIDKDGSVYSVVDEHDIAFHVIGHNSDSIGIELVNYGHICSEFKNCLDYICTADLHDSRLVDCSEGIRWEKFSSQQMNALISLSRNIAARHGLTGENFLSHQELDPERKQDPGFAFPWQEFRQAIGSEAVS